MYVIFTGWEGSGGKIFSRGLKRSPTAQNVLYILTDLNDVFIFLLKATVVLCCARLTTAAKITAKLFCSFYFGKFKFPLKYRLLQSKLGN